MGRGLCLACISGLGVNVVVFMQFVDVRLYLRNCWHGGFKGLSGIRKTGLYCLHARNGFNLSSSLSIVSYIRVGLRCTCSSSAPPAFLDYCLYSMTTIKQPCLRSEPKQAGNKMCATLWRKARLVHGKKTIIERLSVKRTQGHGIDIIDKILVSDCASATIAGITHVCTTAGKEAPASTAHLLCLLHISKSQAVVKSPATHAFDDEV